MTENGSESALLVQFDGEVIRQQWVLDRDVSRIGRLPDNEIVIDDRWVSRYHAEIRRDATQYTVRDLGSKNGTFVNGQRMTAPHLLRDGDQISVAPLYVLTFVDYAATAPLPGQRQAPLELDPDTRSVRVWDQVLDPPLSQIQYDFLALLASNPGRVFTRDETIAAVWPTEDISAISDDAINALVHRLRQRLREKEPHHEFIATLRGYGFRLDLP
jgi:DNA-binding response OmpR family regulator